MIGLRNLCVVIAMVTPTLALAATPTPSVTVRTACTPDAKRLCGAVIHDPEARHKCMIAHRAQLSEACKTALAEDKKAPAATGSPAGGRGESEAPSETAAPPAATAPSGADAPETK